MKYYVCKRMRVLTYLQEHGFNFIKTQPDRNNPSFLVWIFRETKELRDCIEEYYSSSNFINKI